MLKKINVVLFIFFFSTTAFSDFSDEVLTRVQEVSSGSRVNFESDVKGEDAGYLCFLGSGQKLFTYCLAGLSSGNQGMLQILMTAYQQKKRVNIRYKKYSGSGAGIITAVTIPLSEE